MLVCYFRVSREGLISRGSHRKEREDGGVPTRVVPLSRRQASLHISVGGDEPGVFLYLPNHQVQYQQRHDRQQSQRIKIHLEQPRTDIRSHNKLDTFNFRLHEHNPDMFFVRRRRVTTKEVDGF